MNVKNKKAWAQYKANNKDPYGAAVLSFAERWADLMEEKIKSGQTLEAIAKATSHEADTEGITGFMYGCAVQILSQVWERGESLRRWHNGEYGHNGDGVVNPAILAVG